LYRGPSFGDWFDGADKDLDLVEVDPSAAVRVFDSAGKDIIR
jgi:hypothetical protein